MNSNARVLKDIIYGRHSVRYFMDKRVPPELLNQVVDAGRMAPSPTNSQPWRFLVLSGKDTEEVSKLFSYTMKTVYLNGLKRFGSEAMRIATEAPHVIAVWNMKYQSKRLKKIKGLMGNRYYRTYERSELASIGCAVQNMWLMAHTLGLGMVWLMPSISMIRKCTKQFNIDGDITAWLALGYPSNTYQEKRTSRKPLQDICTYYKIP